MGGSNSQQINANTVAAWTYGGKCCDCGTPEWREGAPKTGCCGVPTTLQFEVPMALSDVITSVEEELKEADEIAVEQVSWWSYVFCTACDPDCSADKAARALNADWCQRMTQSLQQHGLRCYAMPEVHGFGRSQQTFLVLRVLRVADSEAQHA